MNKNTDPTIVNLFAAIEKAKKEIEELPLDNPQRDPSKTNVEEVLQSIQKRKEILIKLKLTINEIIDAAT